MSGSDDHDQLRKRRLSDEQAGELKRTGLDIGSDNEALKISPAVDVSQLSGFASRPIEITGIADKFTPLGGDTLQMANANLGKLNEDMRKVREQQKNAQSQAWIDEAQKKIEKRDYKGAITLLNKVLAANSTSGQALFLVGYCQFALQDYATALETLRQAHSQVKSPDLGIMVMMLEILCARAQRSAFENELKEYLDAENYRQALALVRDALAHSPSDPAFMYYECGVLFKMGNVKEARSAATNALSRVGASHATLFRELIAAIDSLENDKLYEEMRKMLRSRSWDATDQLLRSYYSRLNGQRQYEMIKTYVTEKRSGGSGGGGLFGLGRSKNLSLRTDDLQEMLYWLLGEELDDGTQALSANNFAGAHEVFSRAERVDNRFGVICFLHALSLFRLFEQVTQNEPDFDTILGYMTTASSLLETAVRDRVVGQQSRSLKTAVDTYLKQLQKIGSQRQAVQKEVQAINGLFDLFNTTMEYYSKNPISSRSELESAKKLMKGIKDDIAKQKKQHQNNSSAIEALQKLENAVNGVLSQLG